MRRQTEHRWWACAALFAALALCASPGAAQVYRSVNEQGEVVFSDRPSTGAEEVETRISAPADGASDEAEAEIARLKRAASALERDREARAAERRRRAETRSRQSAAARPAAEPKLRRYGRFLVPEGVEPPPEALAPTGG